ncbi:DUF5995 family protein [Aureibacter tunicatorum]|uniref:Uncharacterized protein n=1 Tax=Aureibacter tunicatorum TaxID=866807 RepID=A0AAE3XTL0_9BACT|nr:DUF5995 family protein [Aureibacter tunicatorum]MDR6241838.1 hypothetical protein [Aureibacter tunicatorum]BDD07085.1 hypothetical protein AUTU_45680 [Aureibacter tunicatorum]
MPSSILDETVDQLTSIIDLCIEEESPLGYFPALYRQVTLNVRKAVQNREFEDNERMEKMVHGFANMYIEAFHQFKRGEKPSLPWKIALESGTVNRIPALMHLILGMNAHINYDLAIASVNTAGSSSIKSFQSDFFKINEILGAMIDSVQESLSRVSLIIWLVDKLFRKGDEKLAGFSMDIARDKAWDMAKIITFCSEEGQNDYLQMRQEKVQSFAEKLLKDTKSVYRWVWKFESGYKPSTIIKSISK